MEHHFNIVLAQEYGIEEAILIHNLYYWIHKNACNNKHCHEERYWTYNTTKAFALLFPYMNETKIFRSLKKLEEYGLIIKGNFNEMKTDRTCWYAFSDFAIQKLVTLGYDAFHFVKMQNGDLQNEMTIPNSNINNNIKEKEIDKSISSKKSDDDAFVDHIYDMYPTKCPCREKSLGKSIKDKKLIKRLLSVYSKEEIEAVVKKEIEEKYGKSYMRNFSTFLNNFPDPSYIELPVSTPTESKDTICINGQIYR